MQVKEEGDFIAFCVDIIFSILGQSDVLLSFSAGRVGIVYHERHVGTEAGVEENVFPIPGVQEVQGYSGM